MAMKKDSLMCWAAKISWVVTALASINIGMSLFNYNFFESDFFVMNLQSLGQLIVAVIGLSGAFSFATFVMHCSGKCKSCKV